MTTNTHLKKAVISILIGTAIAFATAILQALLAYLTSLHVNFTGPVAGMVYHFTTWKTNQTV